MAKPKNMRFLEQLPDGRFRIREQVIVDGTKIKPLPLTESTRMIELENGEKVACRGAYAGVEISRPNEENLNERVYTELLWNNVISNQQHIWEGGLGLANHPKDEADVTKTFCVWRNLRFNEKKDLTIADMYLVGENGQLAKEVLDAGGKIGLSSSGFGDFKDDGKTIDEATYELERVADWVDAPSYEVYARKDNELKPENEGKEETKPENSTKNEEKALLSEKEVTNNIDNNELKENDMSDQVKKEMASLEEKNFKINVRKLIKEADGIESLSDKLNEYKEIFTYFEGVEFAKEMKTELEESISELNKEIIALAEKGKTVDSLQESSKLTEEEKGKLSEEVKSLKEQLEKVTEKYELAVKMLEEIREFAKNLEEMNKVVNAEKNGMVDPEDYVVLHKKYEALLSEQDDEEKDDEEDEEEKSEKKRKRREQDEEGDEEEEDEEEDEEEEEKSERRRKLKRKHREQDEEDDEEEEEDEEEMEEMYDFNNKKQIEAYYQDLVKQFPRIRKYKEDFLDCKTLIEAQKLWLELEDQLYSLPPRRVDEDEKKAVKYRKSRKTEGIKRLLNPDWD